MASSENTPDIYPWRVLCSVCVALGCFFLASYAHIPEPLSVLKAQKAAAVMGFVIALWLFQAMDTAGAAMLPLVLFPLLGVSTLHNVATSYAHPILWIFWGGMALATGIERWNVHTRLAMHVIRRIGFSPRKLVTGSMLAATGISMWMNNTATMLLLLPIATALGHTLQKTGLLATHDEEKEFLFSMMYGVAVACTIGGLATPVGTAPNGVFFSNYARMVERGAPPVSFAQWMLFGVPLAAVFIAFSIALLTRTLPKKPHIPIDPHTQHILSLPKATTPEKRMLWVFASLAVLWATRDDIVLPFHVRLPGWWHLFPVAKAEDIGDGAVAVGMAVLSMMIPSGRTRGETLLSWRHLTELPWDILMLLGGGMAMANVFADAGLAHAFGSALAPAIQGIPLWLMLLCVCGALCFISELASNVAVASLFLPICVGVASACNLDPRILMIPATLATSLGFMMPIATPPNAIAFATGHVPLSRMVKNGFIINLAGVVLITLATQWIMVPALGLNKEHVPTWAQQPEFLKHAPDGHANAYGRLHGKEPTHSLK